MDVGLDKRNNKRYFFFELELLPELKIKDIRPNLTCPMCEVRIIFVHHKNPLRHSYFKVINSKKQDHEKRCQYYDRSFADKLKKEREKLRKEAEEILENQAIINLVFDEVKISSSHKSSKNTKTEKSDSREKKEGPINRNLVQLLKYALSSKGFLENKGFQIVNNGYTYNPKARFVNFFEIKERKLNTKIPYFFWGVVNFASINFDSSVPDYLNVGSEEKANIRIEQSVAETLWKKWNVSNWKQVKDSFVIVFGWLNEDKNGNPQLRIGKKDIDKIAFVGLKPRKSQTSKITEGKKEERKVIETKKEPFTSIVVKKDNKPESMDKKIAPLTVETKSNTPAKYEKVQEKKIATPTVVENKIPSRKKVEQRTERNPKLSIVQKIFYWLKKLFLK